MEMYKNVDGQKDVCPHGKVLIIYVPKLFYIKNYSYIRFYMKIAFIGKICSGKSTFANHLKNNHDFEILSFGEPVKRHCKRS